MDTLWAAATVKLVGAAHAGVSDAALARAALLAAQAYPQSLRISIPRPQSSWTQIRPGRDLRYNRGR
jgi:hypothetical protein